VENESSGQVDERGGIPHFSHVEVSSPCFLIFPVFHITAIQPREVRMAASTSACQLV
jgi:hypothetical protein